MSDGSLLWPVYGGRSFNLWQPDTGDYYAWAEPQPITTALQQRRRRGQGNRRSAFSEFSREWAESRATLPCLSPRIAFRDVTNRTNNRTVIAALVPGDRVITNQAPYVLWPGGTEGDEAYLLGVLSSMVLDWFARRVVELHVPNSTTRTPAPPASGSAPASSTSPAASPLPSRTTRASASGPPRSGSRRAPSGRRPRRTT